jgi:hypothetical protein
MQPGSTRDCTSGARICLLGVAGAIMPEPMKGRSQMTTESLSEIRAVHRRAYRHGFFIYKYGDSYEMINPNSSLLELRSNSLAEIDMHLEYLEANPR